MPTQQLRRRRPPSNTNSITQRIALLGLSSPSKIGNSVRKQVIMRLPNKKLPVGAVAADNPPFPQSYRAAFLRCNGATEALNTAIVEVTHVVGSNNSTKGASSSSPRQQQLRKKYLGSSTDTEDADVPLLQRYTHESDSHNSMHLARHMPRWDPVRENKKSKGLGPPATEAPPPLDSIHAREAAFQNVNPAVEVKDVDVDAFCDELLARYEKEQEAFLSGNEDTASMTSPSDNGSSNSSNEESFGLEQADSFEQETQQQPGSGTNDMLSALTDLIDDAEARWTSYGIAVRGTSLVPVRTTTNPLAAPVTPPSPSRSMARPVAASRSVAASSVDYSYPSASYYSSARSSRESEHVILQQQAEIAILKAQLHVNHQQQQGHQDSFLSRPPAEQIDTVPFEEIEVEVVNDDEDDDLSFTSGLTTNLHDLGGRFLGDDMTIDCPLPPSRPDASVADQRSVVPTKHVQNTVLQLAAADGSVRKALYTGPRTPAGACSGVGVLRFVETGDLYTGEVVKGKVRVVRK
jgi:hypothetical protein